MVYILFRIATSFFPLHPTICKSYSDILLRIIRDTYKWNSFTCIIIVARSFLCYSFYDSDRFIKLWEQTELLFHFLWHWFLPVNCFLLQRLLKTYLHVDDEIKVRRILSFRKRCSSLIEIYYFFSSIVPNFTVSARYFFSTEMNSTIRVMFLWLLCP